MSAFDPKRTLAGLGFRLFCGRKQRARRSPDGVRRIGEKGKLQPVHRTSLAKDSSVFAELTMIRLNRAALLDFRHKRDRQGKLE
jgi:hypothetical protein